jgi:hypothetical protein
VTATNGTQRASQSTAVEAAAFHLATSVPAAVRGHAFTLTARTAERLSTTPVVIVRQPGVPAWTVTMTRSTATSWTARITPRKGGDPGSLRLTVKARDADGGRNASALRVALH